MQEPGRVLCFKVRDPRVQVEKQLYTLRIWIVPIFWDRVTAWQDKNCGRAGSLVWRQDVFFEPGSIDSKLTHRLFNLLMRDLFTLFPGVES